MKHLIKFNEEYMVSDGLSLYHFNPNDYDNEYYVMSSSKELALESLLKFLKEKCAQSDWSKSSYESVIDRWSHVNINDNNTFPGKYTIDVYGEGDVIEGEIS